MNQDYIIAVTAVFANLPQKMESYSKSGSHPIHLGFCERIKTIETLVSLHKERIPPKNIDLIYGKITILWKNHEVFKNRYPEFVSDVPKAEIKFFCGVIKELEPLFLEPQAA
ncbi:MAG: hypothetical protein JWM20_847 [Patescibacteria group bacterium]|nr:hypothetical protein [Patescibacteria group bacterium]